MARWHPCIEDGCGQLTQRTRCDDCQHGHEKRRGTRQQRGYDAEHDRQRRAWAQRVELKGFTCWRCGRSFPAGSAFDLGHDDLDRSVTRGPECLPCNRATSGRHTRTTPTP